MPDTKEQFYRKFPKQSHDESYGMRLDGSPKGKGFFGELKRPDGYVSTELSIGVNIDGKETQIPSLVPGLSREQIDYLLAGEKPTKEIVDIAVNHAKKRRFENKSPFAEEGEQISQENNFSIKDRFYEKFGNIRPPSRTQTGKDVFGQSFKEGISLGYAPANISPSAAEEYPVQRFTGSLIGGLVPVIATMATPIPGDEVLGITAALGRPAVTIGKGAVLGGARATGEEFLSPEDLKRRAIQSGQEAAAFGVFEGVPPLVRNVLPGLSRTKQALAETAGIGGGMYELGRAEGQTPEEAALGAATMASLHGITAPFRKPSLRQPVSTGGGYTGTPVEPEVQQSGAIQDIVRAADEVNLRRKLQHPSRQLPAGQLLLPGRTEGEIARQGYRQPFIRREGGTEPINTKYADDMADIQSRIDDLKDIQSRIDDLKDRQDIQREIDDLRDVQKRIDDLQDEEYLGQYVERDIGGREDYPYGQYVESPEVPEFVPPERALPASRLLRQPQRQLTEEELQQRFPDLRPELEQGYAGVGRLPVRQGANELESQPKPRLRQPQEPPQTAIVPVPGGHNIYENGRFVRFEAERQIKGAIQPAGEKPTTEDSSVVQKPVKRVEPKVKAKAVEEDYRGSHRAPTGDFGAGSLDAMDRTYPADVYGKDAARVYGDRVDERLDNKAIALIRKLRGNPDAEVTVYRAVPKGIDTTIEPGDWVTPIREYAVRHGERFEEGMNIIERKVKAGEVFTEGNSLFEYGWNPKPKPFPAQAQESNLSRTEAKPEKIEKALRKAQSGQVSGGIPIPDRATFKAWMETDKAIVRDIIARTVARRIEAYKELPEQIKASLKKAAVYPRQFWEAASKLVQGVATGLKESVENIVRQGLQWLKDNAKLQSRPGGFKNPFIGKEKVSIASQRKVGRAGKRYHMKEADINRIAREQGAKRGASEIKGKLGAKVLVKGMEGRYREGKGIGVNSQSYKQLRKKLDYEGRGFNDKTRKEFLHRHFGVDRLRDLPKENVARMNTLLDGISKRPDWDSIPTNKASESANKAYNQIKEKTIKELQDINHAWARPMEILSKTKSGRVIVERLSLAKAYSAQLGGVIKKNLQDVMIKNEPRIYEKDFLEWYVKDWKGYVESFGKKSLPPEQYRIRAEEIRQAWKAGTDAIADVAEKMEIKGFKRIKEEGYFPDILTPEGRAAIFNGEGDPVYDAIRKIALVKERGLNDAEILELRMEVVNEYTMGSLENPRIANLPETVEVNGKEIRILRSDPRMMIDHIERAARRLGIIKEFGQGDLKANLKAAVENHGREMSKRTGADPIKEARWATEVINTFQGYEPNSIPKKLQPVVAAIRTGQLSLAAIPNLIMGQIPIVVKYGLKGAVKNLYEAFGSSERLETLRGWNGWHKDALIGNMDVMDLQGLSGRVSRRILSATGFNYANRLVNKFSSLQALDYFERMAKSGDRTKLQDLYKEFGFSEARIEEIISRRGLAEIDKIQIVDNVSALTNVTRESSLLRQPWMNKPLANALLTYTSYIRRMSEIAADAVMKAKYGDAAPLAIMVFGNVAGAEATIWLRNWLKGQERRDETVYMRLFNDLLYAGSFGLPGEVANRVYFGAKYNTSLQEMGGGPILGGLNEIYQDFIASPIAGEGMKPRKAARKLITAYPVFENVTGLNR